MKKSFITGIKKKLFETNRKDTTVCRDVTFGTQKSHHFKG